MPMFKKKDKKGSKKEKEEIELSKLGGATSVDDRVSVDTKSSEHVVRTIEADFEDLKSSPEGLSTEEAKVRQLRSPNTILERSFQFNYQFKVTDTRNSIAHIPFLGNGGGKRKKINFFFPFFFFSFPFLKTRLEKYGPNELPKKKTNYVLQFLSYYWSPLAWAMEIAAIVAICLLDYIDFLLILLLLTLNAVIGFYEEFTGGAAVKALQKTLEPTCGCYRDGKLQKDFPSVELVPGDVIFLRLGDVVPADAYVIGAAVEAKIDQAALTGESLPATKRQGDEIYSGSAVKQGEFKALVYATGSKTFFGNAAKLISEAGDAESHIHVVLRSVAWFCISFIIVGVIIELCIQFGVRGKPCKGVRECQTISNCLVLVIGGIPIAMPTVLSVMQALGAVELSKEGAIVVRLTAVEELAGMQCLCSDKTGTLTLNHLTVGEPVLFDTNNDENTTAEQVLWQAALASNKDNSDAIDIAMISSLSDAEAKRYEGCKFLHTHPFDPVEKWTWSKVEQPDKSEKDEEMGGEFSKRRIVYAAKGAPQVILQKSIVNGPKIKEDVEATIEDLAKRGYRAIGVATKSEESEDDEWRMTGLIPLFDPPRHDTKETIEKTLQLGVGVKMITGDQLAIAVETAHLLGMSGNIIQASALKMSARRLEKLYGRDRTGLVDWADGFAQVLPEDKFLIVESLQTDHRMIVGMTGDGVNDAPALKKADIGIAVSDATDAARGASDIVLTKPGLGVIVSAIICSRIIFQRMKSYTSYSVCAALRIVLTFCLLTCIWDFYFPTIATVFFAILNDGTMITLARDRAVPSDKPEKWNLFNLFLTSISLGCYLTLSTLIFYYTITQTQFWTTFGLTDIGNSPSSIRGVIYLQVSVSGLAVVFCTRSHKWMWSHRPSWSLIIAFVLCQGIASVLGAYGINNYAPDPISKGGIAFGGGGWGWVLATWIWCIIWFILVDPIKRLFNLLSRFRLRKVKRKHKHKFPYVISFTSHQEHVVESQRKSYDLAREVAHSIDSVSIDMAHRQSIADLRKAASLAASSRAVLDADHSDSTHDRAFEVNKRRKSDLFSPSIVTVDTSQDLSSSKPFPPMPPPRKKWGRHEDAAHAPDMSILEESDDESDYSSVSPSSSSESSDEDESSSTFSDSNKLENTRRGHLTETSSEETEEKSKKKASPKEESEIHENLPDVPPRRRRKRKNVASSSSSVPAIQK